MHEDRDLVAVDKPSGLLSVPGRTPQTWDSATTRLRDARPGEQGVVVPVHRLDMDTSGVLLFALRRSAERHLQDQFRRRTVAKTYLARVWGEMPEDTGLIDLPLRHAGTSPPTSMVDHRQGKPARTRFVVLRREPFGDIPSTLLRLHPETGRSHQLRVHLDALGHPILGDRFYGTEASEAAAPRLLLHAWRLEVAHPWSGERLSLVGSPPLTLR